MQQQPPRQYRSYPQQQWTPQQGVPLQQQWQQQPYPPQYQPPVPPPKQKRHPKSLWISLGVMLVLIVIISAVPSHAGDGNQSSITGTTPRASQHAVPPTSAAQPTKAAQTTQAATHPLTNAHSALLGADISAFIAKYGQPHSVNGQQNNGGVSFSLYGNPNKVDLTVTTENAKALAILKNSPTNQGWNKSEAIAACLAFAPPDSTYQREMTLLDPQGSPTGIQMVYYSPSLAKLFPASDFTDENANLTTPGTFGIVLGYNINSTSSFLTCSVQAGLQAI